MGQSSLGIEPQKLTKADKVIMELINREFPIDKTTFHNTTPDSTYPYWIRGLKRYQAMDEGWITADPPGPPMTFIVNPANKIFRSMAEALSSIKYVPQNDENALKAAVMIATQSSHPKGKVIVDGNGKADGIPKDVLSNYDLAPSISKNGKEYNIIVFSWVSFETQNKFVRGYHSLWRHTISIDGYAYKETIKILWEKKD